MNSRLTKHARGFRNGIFPADYGRAHTDERGPRLSFALALIVVAAGAIALFWNGAADFVLPAVSTLFLALAAPVAFLAWQRNLPRTGTRVTYWDVAGALTFIGICAGALIDPDQMARIVETNPRRP
jgi:hypothetical protein